MKAQQEKEAAIEEERQRQYEEAHKSEVITNLRDENDYLKKKIIALERAIKWAGLEVKSAIRFADVRAAYMRTHPNFKWNEIISPRRYKNLVAERQVLMWLTKKHTGLSLPQIGRLFGGRDHSTVLHAVRKTEANRDKHMHLIARVESQLGVR